MAQKRPEAFKQDCFCYSFLHTAQMHQLEGKKTKQNTYKTTNGVEAENKGNPLLIHRKKKNV